MYYLFQIAGDNFTILYYELLKKAIDSQEVFIESRSGLVRDLGPAYIEIINDDLRLPLLPIRAVNPYFALAEYAWFITGSDRLDPLKYFIKSYGQYSDDEETLNGAYGYRLRTKFQTDQIEKAITLLKSDPSSRRVMLTMWAVDDLGSDSKDIPCITSIMLKIRAGKLDITIINRSNDLYLGLPYNVFMFYLLQKYLANKIGCSVGKQRHYTDSLHLYKKHMTIVQKIISSVSIESIRKDMNKLNKHDITDFLFLNHSAIVELDFDKISSPYYKALFMDFSKCKEEGHLRQREVTLPKDQLGYACYLYLGNTLTDSYSIEDFLK